MILYHAEGCPKCKMLERQMECRGIEYEAVDVYNTSVEGITSIPVLEIEETINGEIRKERLNYPQALAYITQLGEKE